MQTREQLAKAAENGAEAIGLLDLRGFFDTVQDLPGEEEQYDIYGEIGRIMGDSPVTVVISNWVGHRCPANTDLIKNQLRALLRANIHGNFSILLPRVSHVSEIIKVQQLIRESQAELEGGNLPFRVPGEMGVMADVPAVLAAMDIFCFESKFFIAGEDSLYYLYAADPEIKTSNSILNYFDSAYLSYLQDLVAKAHRRHKRAAVSSPMVDEPAAILLLLGMGYDEIIVAPGKIAATRELVSRLDAHAAKLIASKAISYWEPEKSFAYCRDCLVRAVKKPQTD